MTGPGRPPIGPDVHVRYPPVILARLDKLAKREGVTRAELLRRIAAEYLDK